MKDRVQQILKYLSQGYTDEKIGAILHITRQRVSKIVKDHGEEYPREWASYQETKSYLKAKGRIYND